MDSKEYVDTFFDIAKEMGYNIGRCKRGSARGQKQIDFGNKKLHEGHIRKLYPLIMEKGIEFSYDDFDELVPGRPCAVKGFKEINKKILK
ncbi:MAG: hypothetical protein K8R11_11105 [Methanococcoides sp.]|nr:hypothetical protein [Methanococcoides sp.]